MRRFLVLFIVSIVSLFSVAFIISCGSSSSGGGSPVIGEVYVQGVGDPVPFPGMLQNIDANDVGSAEYVVYFPGHANMWDLGAYFGIDDGGDDQFDGALALSVNSVAAPAIFSSFSDQTYSDLTFYTPLANSTDGVVTASIITDTDLYSGSYYNSSPVIAGTYSAAFAPVSGARIEQTLDLTSATGSISLDWEDATDFKSGLWSVEDGFSVSIINSTTGEELEELFSLTSASGSTVSRNADLTAYAGEVIVLRFLSSGAVAEWDHLSTVVDSVSVQDGNSTEFVTNGDFETGDLTGWTVPEVEMAVNVMSAPQTIDDVSVTRSFYATPDKLWARLTDTFTNPGVSDVSVTVKYSSDLGSDAYGIIYETAGGNGMALSEWDGSVNDRDVGFVMGDVTSVDFTSASALNTNDGVGKIYHYYDITVPAGESVVLVNFIVMTGDETGIDAADINARTTKVDAENLRILNGFNSSAEFRNGMTAAQIANVINF